MVTNKWLHPIVFIVVLIMHIVGLYALSHVQQKTVEFPPETTIELVDLTNFGGAQVAPNVQEAPQAPAPPPKAIEQPKPKPKEKPKPKPKPKVKPVKKVIARKEPAPKSDLVMPKETKKEEPKKEPEPKKEKTDDQKDDKKEITQNSKQQDVVSQKSSSNSNSAFSSDSKNTQSTSVAGTGSGSVVPATHVGNYLKNPKPRYPYVSLENGEEGIVRLEVVVEPDGRPSSVKVIKSSGYYRLDEVARDTVKKYWRFKPATRGGIPIQFTYEFNVNFKIDSP